MFRTKFTFTDANWLESMRQYVLDPDARILDLHHSNLTMEDMTLILKFLANSEICELDLSYNNLQKQMATFSLLFLETKIRRLNVASCGLRRRDTTSLMKILKHSQITDLDISENKCKLQTNKFGENFLSHLTESHLTSLIFCRSGEFNTSVDVSCLINAVCATSITHLNLDGLCDKPKSDLHHEILSFFHHLKHSAITHLSFARNELNCCKSLNFGDSLRESKLIELDLSNNRFSDKQLDELFLALVRTQITSLNLAGSSCRGSCKIFRYLKETRISRLDLSKSVHSITSEEIFDFPNFLSGSSVVSLNLQGCCLSDEIGVKIMSCLKSSNLKELDVSCNLFKDSTMLEFYNAVSDTAISSINLGGSSSILIRCLSGSYPNGVAKFFEVLKTSCITSVKLQHQRLGTQAAKIVFPSLAHSKLTLLDLGFNYLGGGLSTLATILKFTVLTHLNLENNCINDNNVKALAACFKESKIIFLNLGFNEITNVGAEALALSLKGTDILNLDLNYNQIDNPGLLALASYAMSTFINILNVRGNPGNGHIVETVMWNNRRCILQLVRFFKQVAPKCGTNSFQFESSLSLTDIDTFCEECLNFCSIIAERSSAALVLAQNENVALSRDQITALLIEEFPIQFAQFIVTKIEPNISKQIDFLYKVEEMGLIQIVKLLLLNRSVYMINHSRSILHPYVYQLLYKYKLPVCDSDVGPCGIERIIEYFTEFLYIEGASDVISMLKCM